MCEKYIYEIILEKKVVYQYNDRQIWSEILPNIIGDMSDGSEGNEEMTEQNDGNENGNGNEYGMKKEYEG